MRELKVAPHFLVKANNTGREITGIFSTFGVRDSMDDIVHPGAMVESFKARADQILFLWSHQFEGTTTAVITDIKEVPRQQLPQEMLTRYPETTGGALVTRRYLPSPAGENAYQSVLNSPIQMSFGYNPQVYDFSTTADGVRVRNLRKVDVLEVSDVLWGANSNTASNIAAQKGYRYAGGLGGRTSKRVPWLRQLERDLRILELQMLGVDTTGLEWDAFVADLPTKYRRGY